MALKAVSRKLFYPALGAVLTGLCGLALWALPLGEAWRLASYDTLFRFATRPVTNQVALVFLDNESLSQAGLARGQPWDRARHARFLDRLTADGCPLVVFDIFFDKPGDAEGTRALAEAMRRHSNVVLAANQTTALHQSDPQRAGVYSVQPVPLLEVLLDAVRRTNWGVGGVNNVNRDRVVRQHWKFPSPGVHYDSVAWTAARQADARLSSQPQERWIRYYAHDAMWTPGAPWKSLSYIEAELQTNGFFRGTTVFIGSKPKDHIPYNEPDEFSTPLTEAHGLTVGGIEILATEFLNLVNGEWLERPPRWIEVLALLLAGVVLSFSLHGRRGGLVWLISAGAGLGVMVLAVYLTHFTKYWFPWLIVAGGQVPAALLFAWLTPARTPAVATSVAAHPVAAGAEPTLEVPDYELIQPPFGAGAYGKVFLARNAVNQWQAIKVVYRAKFGDDASPYEREFRGIQNYKRVSDQHPGLLRIDFVSRMKPGGYFYYAMELGDAAVPGWRDHPVDYKPLDLAALCTARNELVPVRECLRIGRELCQALNFLHAHGLTHRDIKPRNIIFVQGRPKLADVGLVADAHRPVQDASWVGTPGYMPPPPEPPGTPQADIYGLGMLLYVISTGLTPTHFPELSTIIVDHKRHPEFPVFSPVIFRACHPNRDSRYQTAEEMHAALLEVEARLARAQAGG